VAAARACGAPAHRATRGIAVVARKMRVRCLVIMGQLSPPSAARATRRQDFRSRATAGLGRPDNPGLRAGP
jgi:hypothetical protein